MSCPTCGATDCAHLVRVLAPVTDGCYICRPDDPDADLEGCEVCEVDWQDYVGRSLRDGVRGRVGDSDAAR